MCVPLALTSGHPCQGICPMFTQAPKRKGRAGCLSPFLRCGGLRVAAHQLCKFCLTQGHLLLALLGEVPSARPPPACSPSGKGRSSAAWVWKHPGKVGPPAGEKGEQTGGEVLSLPGTNSIDSFTLD